MLCVAQAEESQSETMNYGNIRPEHYGSMRYYLLPQAQAYLFY